MRRAVAIALASALVAMAGAPAAARSLPPLPRGWPHTFALGLTDPPADAAALRRSVPLGFRYQYLAGGAGTPQSWTTWNPGGSFVSMYVRESIAARITPVFSYYVIRQTPPGRDDGDEARADLGNLADARLMRTYLTELRLFFERAGAFHARVVLQLEPDMWGYAEQAARGDDAGTLRAAVSSTGLRELAGLPNTLPGLARAAIRLRDRYARNVLVAYHLSDWGTGVDIALGKPSPSEVRVLSTRAARFYRSLGARFDLTFTDVADRDAAFKQIVEGQQGAWWNAADFAREQRFLAGYARAARQRVAIWQIPLGNTLMRAMNDTWGHYQDNRVQWWLGDRRHLAAYVRAGVVALLFGGGATGTTCACDADRDGVTNPPPIDGNDRPSLSADDDGGLFRALARALYRARPMTLPR